MNALNPCSNDSLCFSCSDSTSVWLKGSRSTIAQKTKQKHIPCVSPKPLMAHIYYCPDNAQEQNANHKGRSLTKNKCPIQKIQPRSISEQYVFLMTITFVTCFSLQIFVCLKCLCNESFQGRCQLPLKVCTNHITLWRFRTSATQWLHRACNCFAKCDPFVSVGNTWVVHISCADKYP